MTTADLDGNGTIDLATANNWFGDVSVLRNLGNGAFTPQVTYASGASCISVVAADFDGDGVPDLATANQDDGKVSVLRNRGDGTLEAYVDYPAGSFQSSPNDLTAADVDGDGAIDLLTANYLEGDVAVLRNLGNGTFAPPVFYAAGSSASCVTAADVDGNGAVDLIATDLSNGAIRVLINQGDGSFGAPVTYAVSHGLRSTIVADVDGDGAVDLITASDQVWVLRNLGDGRFGPPCAYAVSCAYPGSPQSLAAADVDGDGAMDLITANGEGNSVSVLQNLGDGTFAAAVVYEIGMCPADVVASDMDGNAAVDLITVNPADNSILVLWNLGDETPDPVATTTTLTADPTSGSVYGETVTFTANVTEGDPLAGTPTGCVQWIIDGSNFGSPLALEDGSVSVDLSALTAGNHSIQAIYTSDDASLFQDSQGLLSFDVARASLTITADDLSMLCGSALPQLTASYDGFVNGDTPASLTQQPVLSTTARSTSAPGTYAITVSDAASPDYTITIVAGTLTVLPRPNAAMLVDDPLSPGETMLAVYGTTRNDRILIMAGRRAGDISVSMNGRSKGTFHPTSRIEVHGLAGNDQVQAMNSVVLPLSIFGDDGNDSLRGGGGPSLLLGGAGADQLWGGKGRTVLIGGAGKDMLWGGQGETVLIGGTTAHDANDQALLAILAEWNSSADYAIRVEHLTGTPGGANGSSLLHEASVRDDATADQIHGGLARDLYFLAGKDKPSGRRSNEIVVSVG